MNLVDHSMYISKSELMERRDVVFCQLSFFGLLKSVFSDCFDITGRSKTGLYDIISLLCFSGLGIFHSNNTC